MVVDFRVAGHIVYERIIAQHSCLKARDTYFLNPQTNSLNDITYNQMNQRQKLKQMLS